MSLCKVCQKELYSGNKSGFCAPCWNVSDEKKAKASAAAKRNWQKPELRAIYIEQGTKNVTRPDVVAKRKEAVQAKRTWEIARKAITPEIADKAIQRGTETKMAHIPREYRAEYRKLTRTMRYSAAEASAMIAEQHEKDMAAFRRRVEGAVLQGHRNYLAEMAE